MPVRRCLLQDASASAAGIVHLPLYRLSSPDQLCVWHLGHLSPLQAAGHGAAELLFVSVVDDCVCKYWTDEE